MDTLSFKRALRRVLRQDPDVILIGEMRDEETVHTALSAAETGHLVLSTVHTVDAAETVNRIIDFFPPHMHQQVRAMLAGTLKGVISQRLVRSTDGGRVATCEILRMTGRVRDMIMDPMQTGRLTEVVSEGAYYGMQTFDQALFDHVKAGRVDVDQALKAATSPHDFKLLLAADGTQRHDDGRPRAGRGQASGVRVGRRSVSGPRRKDPPCRPTSTQFARRPRRAFALQNSKLLKVRLDQVTIQAKLGAMVAYQGDVTFEHAGGGGLGRLVKKVATGEGQSLMKITGTGEVFLADTAQDIHLFYLQDDRITVNGRNVLAFDAGIDWDIERVKSVSGMMGGGLFNTKLHGTGWVARADRRPAGAPRRRAGADVRRRAGRGRLVVGRDDVDQDRRQAQEPHRPGLRRDVPDRLRRPGLGARAAVGGPDRRHREGGGASGG